jgi:transcriptional regulator with XRE-family HTH domain
MANERLRNAMKVARIDMNAVAEAANVDHRTVQRWMQGRVPRANHRWKVARLLGEREDFLWPTNNDKEAITASPSPEIIAAYTHRADVPAEAWWHLFLKAQQHIDLLGYAISFLPEQHPSLTSLLKEKSMTSCKIRIALADPMCMHVQQRDGEEQLGGTLPALIRSTLYQLRDLWTGAGIEIRYHTTPLYNSLFRFDDEMFVTPHLYGLHGSKAPLLHLRQFGAHGIFANFAAHFEAIWAVGTAVEHAPDFIIKSVE